MESIPDLDMTEKEKCLEEATGIIAKNNREKVMSTYRLLLASHRLLMLLNYMRREKGQEEISLRSLLLD